MGAVAWSDERVTVLRDMHARGCGFTKIARALGMSSRTAVVGKAYRLGLIQKAETRVNAANIAGKARARASQAERKVQCDVAQDLAKIDRLFEGRTDGVRFLERSMFQCAMILPATEEGPIDELQVCGQPVVAGTSWCPGCLPVVAASPRFRAYKDSVLMSGVTA